MFLRISLRNTRAVNKKPGAPGCPGFMVSHCRAGRRALFQSLWAASSGSSSGPCLASSFLETRSAVELSAPGVLETRSAVEPPLLPFSSIARAILHRCRCRQASGDGGFIANRSCRSQSSLHSRLELPCVWAITSAYSGEYLSDEYVIVHVCVCV